MKKSNNIISDWLEKYGDPKIDKKVEMELERITKERYTKIIDEAYRNYVNNPGYKSQCVADLMRSQSEQLAICPTIEEFINKCKTNKKFSEKWDLNIEEHLLVHSERKKLMDEYTDSRNMFRIGYQVTLDGFNYDKYNEVCDKYNIPSKLITLTYKNEKIEIHE
jgi:hypothetical protein